MAVYACSDLHGCMKFYKEIKKILQPEDKVFFLGDAGDRGPEPWETIQAIAKDRQFVYLKGNHEDMLAEALVDFVEKDYMGSAYRCLCGNGGYETFNGAVRESHASGWSRWLNKLPTMTTYENEQGQKVILSHAGLTPYLNDEGKEGFHWDEDLIWNREHFFEPWPEDEEFKNTIVVHGHTPIPYLWEDLGIPEEDQIEGAFWYCDNHKVCIDTGAVWTGICVLINLDTWEEYVFELDKN